MKDGRLSLTWLEAQFNNFEPLLDDADEEQIMRYARTYILTLIGGIVFPSKTNTMVHLMYLRLLENLQRAETYS